MFTSHTTLNTTLKILIAVLILGAFLWYVVFQARLLITGPVINLTNTNTGSISTARTVLIEGTVENVVTITLNGRPIFVDEQGKFRQPLVLENGYTIMTLEAEDRYGRTTSLERSFVYQSSEEPTL